MTIPEDRTEVWLAMANPFLDSEERPDVPRIAMIALRAGLTVEEARRVWMYEVAPALSWNLWSVAGAWGAWDPAFVLARIRASRRDPSCHHVFGALGYLISMAPFMGMFGSIADTMRVLEEVEGAAREERASDLIWLAQHFFDFGAWPAAPADRPRLARTYEACFHRAMRAAILGQRERSEGAERVRRAVAS